MVSKTSTLIHTPPSLLCGDPVTKHLRLQVSFIFLIPDFRSRSWSDGAMVKSTCYSCKSLKLHSCTLKTQSWYWRDSSVVMSTGCLEDADPIPSTHMIARRICNSSSRWSVTLLSISVSTRHTHSVHTYMQKTHPHQWNSNWNIKEINHCEKTESYLTGLFVSSPWLVTLTFLSNASWPFVNLVKGSH